MYDITNIIDELHKYQNGTTNTFTIVIFILTVIAMFRIFEKAGESGIKSIIPIYNIYTLCNILKLNFFYLLLACLLLLIPIVNLLSSLYLIYFYFAINNRLARAFGHTFLFGIGLILFNTIFILILGFNNDKYKKAYI